MFKVQGKYNDITVFTDNVEQTAMAQMYDIANSNVLAGTTIKVMPDVHAGNACVIGLTHTITDKVIPNLVGQDIGCGMFVAKLGDIEIDLPALDEFINNNIPSGAVIYDNNEENAKRVEEIISELKINKNRLDLTKIINSAGTLGGGNHFIEVNIDNDNNKYLVIHTGSRSFGMQVFKYYQKLAVDTIIQDKYEPQKIDNDSIKQIIEQMKKDGQANKIQETLNQLLNKRKNTTLSDANINFAYLKNDNLKDYIHDLDIVTNYAKLNRQIIAEKILNHLNLDLNDLDNFQCVHNYIDKYDNIVRKSAISAKKDEQVIIPINMRDGSILAVGKGNNAWNNSAPHGAGRRMSRSVAKNKINFEIYKNQMKYVYTTSVTSSTLDESPDAYKPIDEIIDNIGDTVNIQAIIKPIYNFKAH